MLRTPLVLALLCVPLSWQAVFAGPPEGRSGKLIVDEASRLRDDIQRLEREVERDNSDPRLSEELDMARARLAAAEGRIGAARAAWQKVITAREVEWAQWHRSPPRGCSPMDPVILRGRIAEARCGLAEVEGDRAVLAKELPKVIAWHEAMLRMRDDLRKAKAIEPEETEEERAIRKDLRQLRCRLEVVQGR